MENREEYRSENGVVAWWQKDGFWHLAAPRAGENGFFWTDCQFDKRQDAIDALDKKGS